MNNSNLKLKAINKIEEYFDNGFFLKELNERVKIQTVSRKQEKSSELYKYFQENLLLIVD